jgi:hypothetical protein
VRAAPHDLASDSGRPLALDQLPRVERETGGKLLVQPVLGDERPAGERLRRGRLV